MHHTALTFRKMNGLGNDFVVLDARAEPLPLNTETIRAICARSGGIGCDQLLVIEPSDRADVFMRIYNADGSEASACGNGARCVAKVLLDETGKEFIALETLGGVLKARRAGDLVTINMGAPKFKWDDIPLSEPFHDTRGIELQIGPVDAPILHTPSVVNVGNPHAVFFVDDLNCTDLAKSGPMLETHPLFPEGANISLARIDDDEHISVKVWERGAGLTKACGTAACAVAVCAARRKLTGRNVSVRLPGGILAIEWRDDDAILMTGPAEDNGVGVIPENLLSASGQETSFAG